MKLNIQNTFSNELQADANLTNVPRQVRGAFFSYVTPKSTANPKLIHYSKTMAQAIGVSEDGVSSDAFLKVFTGNKVLPNTEPYAMCYGGHQFGNWAGQLGDGRAINLGEVVHNNNRWTLQLKGAGATPYSRSADGLAVLRSSIREYLCSEAMHYLGVPTTRALSLCLTGDEVLRDVLYNGNQAYEKGAIVTRLAPSFIRFGNFEIFAANNDLKNLKKLADYTIKHFYPNIKTTGKDAYIEFFKQITTSSLDMVIHWQRVGFVHGVMNTDNMSILGLTIDYGPYGWLEDYDPGWTPNTTDRQHKRYRYGNQPKVVQWNLFKLANALFPLIEDAAPLEAILESYAANFEVQKLEMMRLKLGLYELDQDDVILIEQLEEALQLTETDMTIFFRNLANISNQNPNQALEEIKEAFYKPEELKGAITEKWSQWMNAYLERLEKEIISAEERKQKMNAVNPKYVLRNYMAQLAIDDAEKGDYQLIDELFRVLKKPYEAQPEHQKWFAKRPDWARHKVGCSMLSCSS